MRSIVYVESGGQTKALRAECRKGFSQFFKKAGLKGHMPRISACGGRQQAYDDFCHALNRGGSDRFVALLVDSEGPVAKGSAAWTHLKKRDNWNKPVSATDDNAHLMVQCMESWFLADKDALANYFGAGFNRRILPRRSDIEEISKPDLNMGLKNATRQSVGKRTYEKGRHSFAILARISPEKVITASRHAQRLIDTLLNQAATKK